MKLSTPQYITDEKGNKISVVLSLREYRKIIEELEELNDIRLFDNAMKEKSEPVLAKDAFAMIERKRKK